MHVQQPTRTMSLFDRRPRLFQVLFTLFTLLLIAASALNLHHLTISPTDENIFVDPSSFVAINADAGGLRVGDQILRLGKSRITTTEMLEAFLDTTREATLTITYLRPAKSKPQDLTMPRKEIERLATIELPPHVRVTQVLPGGASERAGMMVGDLITHINGVPSLSALQADSVLRSGATGKSYTYSIIRNNRPMDLQIVLAAIGIALNVVGYALTGLVFLAIALLVAKKRPEAKAARLLSIACLLLFAAPLLTPYGLTQNVRWFYYFAPISLACYALGFAVFAHAFLYFPYQHSVMLQRRWPLIVFYALMVVTVTVTMTFTGNAALSGVMFQVTPVGIIFLWFRKNSLPENRRLMRVFVWSSVLVFGVIFLLAVGAQAQLLRVSAFLLPIIPLALLYTIGRHRLFDLNLRIRKNIQFSLASTLWTLLLVWTFFWLLMQLLRQEITMPAVQITGTSIEVLSSPMPAPDQETAQKVLLMLLAIVLALIFWRLGKAGYRFLAGRFYRGAYDYRKAAREMSAVLTATLNMEELGRGIVQKLSALMRLKRAGVLFFRNERLCCCREALGFDGTAWQAFCMRYDKEIMEWLSTQPKEVPVHAMPPPLQAEFIANDLQIAVPIRSKDKLIGALLIGEKRSESSFGQEDYEFLASTARQASVAIENSFLYEELAEKERLKHELALARRIQVDSLPQATPTIDGLDIAGASIPALEVGGDYFDYLNGEPSSLTVIIGDVSGKGTSAALYMSKIQGILRSLHGFGLSPRDLFVRANDLMRHDLASNAYITAMAASFNVARRSLTLARAGHLPLYHYVAATDSMERLLPQGLGIGISENTLFAERLEEITITFGHGDVFLFLTDGITEGRRADNAEFGEERILTLMKTWGSSGAARDLRDAVLASVRDFAGSNEQHDDQTVVVVKILNISQRHD